MRWTWVSLLRLSALRAIAVKTSAATSIGQPRGEGIESTFYRPGAEGVGRRLARSASCVTAVCSHSFRHAMSELSGR
jgi:hypothetical protein